MLLTSRLAAADFNGKLHVAVTAGALIQVVDTATTAR